MCVGDDTYLEASLHTKTGRRLAPKLAEASKISDATQQALGNMRALIEHVQYYTTTLAYAHTHHAHAHMYTQTPYTQSKGYHKLEVTAMLGNGLPKKFFGESASEALVKRSRESRVHTGRNTKDTLLALRPSGVVRSKIGELHESMLIGTILHNFYAAIERFEVCVHKHNARTRHVRGHNLSTVGRRLVIKEPRNAQACLGSGAVRPGANLLPKSNCKSLCVQLTCF